MQLTKDDLDAMARSIAWVRQHRPDHAGQIDAKIRCEGAEAAAEFAACIAQSANLKLRPWETSPSHPWGIFCDGAIDLRDRLLAAGLSIYEPNPMQALAEAERKQRTA